ncbi:MAG: type III-B CRISPR-associated protein Cas10/Cmr2 [Chloroflexi bacterium]|nr:type III-B CRISPR-associated protein Cas10/Cmr2 [Chloroflexota bacterium]
MTYLFLFQIGPVQTFIAQARRTQDLFIGSHLLSELASAGVLAISEHPSFKPIFPLVENRQVKGGAPHRFAFLCDDDPSQIAEKVQSAIESRWQEGFVQPVGQLVWDAVGDGEWVTIFERQGQASSWLEFYWVAVPYNDEKHGDSFKNASVAVAQRKYARTFHVLEEPGYKCTLTGMQSALDINWKKLRHHLHDSKGIILRDNERLGTLALIKRLAEQAKTVRSDKKIYSTTHIAQDNPMATEEAMGSKDVSGYLAVLHMDGDQMGKHLRELHSYQQHQEFSGQLADFAANEVQRIVKAHGGETGVLVYSGGDDVLALLPLRHALRCADELRKLFQQMTGCTASAGIAITPANLPLDRALELAREAEEAAKEKYGRNAVVVLEAHGGGQMREAGGKWTIIDFIIQLQALFESNTLSGKLGYDLLALDHDLHGDHLKAARRFEVHRIAKRRTAEGVSYERTVQALINNMINQVEEDDTVLTWVDMANWVILARFLAQGAEQQ